MTSTCIQFADSGDNTARNWLSAVSVKAVTGVLFLIDGRGKFQLSRQLL